MGTIRKTRKLLPEYPFSVSKCVAKKSCQTTSSQKGGTHIKCSPPEPKIPTPQGAPSRTKGAPSMYPEKMQKARNCTVCNKLEKKRTQALVQRLQRSNVPCALCPVPCALCPVPCALCPVPCALCPVSNFFTLTTP
eukprot:TRINITY_DN227_c1_g1_i3.p2 TRINITY_DN227_c1_g1~~TRINITY_DN227_c1_g1_i3.p2  ORF type:complete len:136 (-),score=14.13 TRINITY_DN227_c1_g1_i3:954-1361(-)